jgi:site-specific DNA-methyltransferase (adenine-specific)
MEDNVLYYGDNLDVLRRHVKDETIDLVYLDPPFNSNATYNVLFAEQNGAQAAAQIKAFEDTWKWDEVAAKAYQEVVEAGGKVSETMQAFRLVLGDSNMLAYLAMMAPRLMELRRVMKPTGSIYLHCDPTASHYLKLIMDSVFGPPNFRSEIVWRRKSSHNKLTRQYGPIHDTILFYSRSEDFVFHPGYRPYSKAYIEARFKYQDSRGRYQTNYLTGPGVRHGESGQDWRGFSPTSAGRHWAIPASLRQFLPNDGEGMGTIDQLEALYSQDFVVFPKKEGGQPMYKQYIGPGVFYQDIWAYQPNTSGVLFESDEHIDEDVKYLESEEEKLGFETQKPVGLLARIINTSSDENAVVLDPFCGCGTTIAAAQRLNRRWIGIDITHLAITLIKHRLRDTFEDKVTYKVIGEPVSVPDAETLAQQDPYQFQWWALGLVGARPVEQKKGADKGIDGRLYFHDEADSKTKQVIISVKAGHTSAPHLRDLRGVLEREKAEIGVLITMQEPTSAMRSEAAGAGFYTSQVWGKSYPRLQILTVADLLSGKGIDMPPLRQVSVTFKKAPKGKVDKGEQTEMGLN